jgi:hypothetical protein
MDPQGCTEDGAIQRHKGAMLGLRRIGHRNALRNMLGLRPHSKLPIGMEPHLDRTAVLELQ